MSVEAKPVTLSLFDRVGLAPEPGAPTASDILWALRRRYSAGWSTFPEFALAADMGDWKRGDRTCSRIDLLAVSFANSIHYGVDAIEIKVSRADFLSEIRDPGKRAPAEAVANSCWFAVAENVCEPQDVPDPWGLYIYSKKGRLARKKDAVRREVDRPRWFIGHLARRAAPMNPHHQLVRDRLQTLRWRLREAYENPRYATSYIRSAEEDVRALQRPEDR